MENKNIFNSWITRIESGEGFTSNLLGFEPKTGFAIASQGNEYKIKVPTTFKHTTIHRVLLSYIQQHIYKLINGAFLGVWIHEGFIYFDLSEVEPDFTTAINKGIANKQLAIYDLGQGVEISLKGLSNIKNEPKIGQAEAKSQMNITGE